MNCYLLTVLLIVVLDVVLARLPAGQNIIIIQIDGYGAGLLNNSKHESTIGIREIIEHGGQAERLKSVFPTQNWPTWVSAATGLYTENHGIIADYIWDSKTGESFQQGVASNESHYTWWSQKPAPFWYTAAKQNVDIHCYWYAHCHLPHQDLVVQVPPKRIIDVNNPSQSDRLSEIFPEIINRIKKYEVYRQQMFLIHFSGLAHAQKTHGANSDETDQALTRIDLYLHELQKLIGDQNLWETTNLIVYSDHGLVPMLEEEQFYVEECLSDYSKIKKVVNSHSMMMIYTDPEDEGPIHFELRVCDQWAPTGDYDDSDVPMVKVFKMSELPEELHWKDSPFMSGVVLITKPGTSVITRELSSIPSPTENQRELKMESGWEPEINELHGIFVARGPAFKENVKGGELALVDLYQCFLNILGVEPDHDHNGTWDGIGELMTKGWEERPTSRQNSGVVYCNYIPLLLSVLLLLRF
ncbi:unnamed protein product [Auanema sp. JU1783]|nr:unnamed protein product [Auanema sp. JU1783]